MADKMAAMKNFLIYFIFIFTTYLMQNWVVSLTHLLLSNISDISHYRSIHSAVGSRAVGLCPLRQSDLRLKLTQHCINIHLPASALRLLIYFVYLT